jgi:2-dehydro-3-deoxygluconokinase
VTDVVTFGEAMAVGRGAGPLRLGGQLELSVAGAEANVAIGLARLGHRVRWIGRVGADETGHLVRRTLRAEQVDVSAVRTDRDRPTGFMIAERRISDVVRVLYYRAGSAGSQVAAEDVLGAIEPGVRLVHLTGITMALSDVARQCVIAAVTRAREVGATVTFDVNHRARLWSADDARAAIRPILPFVDVVFASVDELAIVADGEQPTSAVRELLDQGVGEVVVKRGADGASVHTTATAVSVAARQVPVVDVVGAGDAFVAGYLSAQLDGADLTTRLERGAVTAAFAVSRRGDWEGLPTRDELALLQLPTGTTVR